MPGFKVESYRGGISDFDDKGITGSFKTGSKNLDIRKKRDTLSCQQALVNETPPVSGFTDLMTVLVPSSDGNTYGFSRDGKIYKRTSSGVWTYLRTNVNGGITGAKEWQISNGNKYIFYAAGQKLGRKPLPGNADWSDAVDTYKNDLDNAGHHMELCNGQLLIANNNKLASVDYEDNYSNSVLDVVPGNVVNTLIERGRETILGTKMVSAEKKGYFFTWDQALSAGSEFTWNDKKAVFAKGVNAMIDTEYPLAQVGTNGGLFWSDMQNISPLMEISGGGYSNPESVTFDEGLALFGIQGNADGLNGIYSWGRKRHNVVPVLNLEYQITCDEIGAVCNVGDDILASVKIGSSYYVKKVSSSQKAIANYYGVDLLAAARLLPRVGWNAVQLFTEPLSGNNMKVEVFYRCDKTGSFKQANLEDGTTAFIGDGKTEGLFYCGDTGRIFEYYFVITPDANNTPEIKRHEIYTSA